MALDPSMMYCAVRIVGDVEDSRTKIGRKRAPIGTGFLISMLSETIPKHRYCYVVTANHVVDEQTKVEIQIPHPLANGELQDALPIEKWFQPLDGIDLALALIPNGSGQSLPSLEFEIDLIPDDVGWLHLGATVHYVGILVPLDRPMVRTGVIGALDQTDLPDTPPGYSDYPLHLVDCRSYDGFSGSPCFLDVMLAGLDPVALPPHRPPVIKPSQVGAMYHVAVLCGMFIEHLDDHVRGEAISRYGVGIMLRGNEIREALMTDEMRKERRGWDEENAAAAKSGGPRRTQASASHSDPDAQDEFKRFEDLTRNLVQVPKKEIDEERKRKQGGQ